MKNHKKWIMGLDVGTASSAISAYECDDTGTPIKLSLLDATIFSEPINLKNLELLNQSRRTDRLTKRQIKRRASNRIKLLHIASSLGLDKKKLKQHHFAHHIHEIRVRALTEKLDIYQLFSVFLNMLQNRGAGHLKEYKELGNEIDGKLLSEYLQERKKAAEDKREPWRNLQQDSENTKTYYYARFLLEKEFEKIVECQKQHHPFFEENYTGWPDGAFKKDINTVINYHKALQQTILNQRPLKWDIETIGDCPYKENCKVATKAHPSYQNFRIEDQIANLRLKDKPLNQEQKAKLRAALHATDELKFTEIYELLDLQEKFTIDIATNSNKELVGNKTLHAMKKLEFGVAWDNLDIAEQAGAMMILANLPDPNYIKENVFDALQNKFKEILQADKSYEYQPHQYRNMTNFLIELSAHKKFGSLTTLGLENGRGNYSSKAYQELADMMASHNYDKTNAIKELAYEELDQDDVITNPIILKSIRQVKKLYKEMVRKMGSHPSRISLELMRELKQSTALRGQTNSKIEKNRKRREDAAKESQAHGIMPTDKNIKRFNLCREQEYKCAYTGEPIEVNQLEHYEIDHIIPQAKGGGNGHSNLVLVQASINKSKDNRTPYEAYQAGIISEQGWRHIQNTAKHYMKDFDSPDANGKKKKPVGYDAILYRKGQLLISQDEPRGIQDGAMDRRNTETAYIARLLQKKLVKWSNGTLKNTDIVPMRGLVTGNLRRQWDIDSILPQIRLKEGRPLFNKQGERISKADFANHENRGVEKYTFDKRCDHRHHLIDAAILGLCTRSLLQKASTYYHGQGNLKGSQFASPIENLRQTLLNYLSDFVVWQKPDRYGSGRFLQDTFYALKEDNQLVVREPVEKLLKSNYQTTLENIEKRVYDHDIKQNMLAQLKEKQTQNIDLKQAIQEIYYPKTSKNKVKKVKAIYWEKGIVKYNDAVDYKKSYSSGRESVHLNDGYACAMINKDNKVELITKLQYQKNPEHYQENGLFKGDIIFNHKQQRFYEICSFSKIKGIFYKLANETQPFGTIKIKELKLMSNSFKDFELIKTKGQLYSKLAQLRKAKPL